MLFSTVVAQRPLECGPITPDKLVASVQDHLRSVGTLRGQAGRINTLPFGERGRGVRIFPTEIVPVRYMLADTDDELPCIGLLQIDLAQQRVGWRAARTSL